MKARPDKFSLYSEQSYLAPGEPHVPILIPFWGQTPEDPQSPTGGRYDRYESVGRSFLQIGPLAQCDAAIFPQSWEHTVGDDAAEERAAAFVAQANEAGKPTVIFYWADSAEPARDDAVVFRTSFYRSRRRPNEFAQPAWSEDFIERYLGGTLPLRKLEAHPVVGFCGYAPNEPVPQTGWQVLRRKLGNRKRRFEAWRGRPVEAGYVRTRALTALEGHADVETNFVLRAAFWGGVIDSTADPDTVMRLRREYVQNMVDSDYVLCARGGGNFSYRLYETLSCGRIPVFVDTDCVLPLEHEIDWRELCVWVDEHDVAKIGDRVAGFHASLTPADFADRQRACRHLWETHLSPHGFFKHFAGNFG
jgi:hypothetical protein